MLITPVLRNAIDVADPLLNFSSEDSQRGVFLGGLIDGVSFFQKVYLHKGLDMIHLGEFGDTFFVNLMFLDLD